MNEHAVLAYQLSKRDLLASVLMLVRLNGERKALRAVARQLLDSDKENPIHTQNGIWRIIMSKPVKRNLAVVLLKRLARAGWLGLVRLRNALLVIGIAIGIYFGFDYAADWLGQGLMETIGQGIAGLALVVMLLIMGLCIAAIVAFALIVAFFWLRDVWQEAKEEEEEQRDELTDDGD